MSRAFLLSIAIHVALIMAIVYGFRSNEVIKKADTNRFNKISLAFVTLKKESKKNITVPKEIKVSEVERKSKKSLHNKQKFKTKKILKKALLKSAKKVKTKNFKKKISQKKSFKVKPKTNSKISYKKKYSKKRVNRVYSKAKKTHYKRINSKKKYIKKNSYRQSSSYLMLNKSLIYQAIQRAKSYPIVAKRLNIQGVVRVSFTIYPNGSVGNIVTSNAHSILQKSAKETILKASREFPKPKNNVNVSVNISYNLR